MAARQDPRDPFIVVILGCTGTGKSKLAIEVGKEIGGEIISADSMQVYKGLDVITNKVTREEQAMIPHHMIDIVKADERFSVVEFKNMALSTISDIVKRQKVPIIVGGTNYYIESLLWENLIEETKQNVACPFKSNDSKDAKHKHGVSEHEVSTHEVTGRGNSEPQKEEHKTLQETSDHEMSEHEVTGLENSKQQNSTSKTLGETSKLELAEHEKLKHETIYEDAISEDLQGKNLKRRLSPSPKSKLGCLEEGSENVLIKKSDRMGTNQNRSPVALYLKLAEIDATMAQKLHPNDTRKITRSLQVYENCGITHSELIAQQQAQEGATVYGGPMRFKNACVLWLQCDLETLDKRLDARVDKMIEQGLVKELVEFHNYWKSHSVGLRISNTEGIFQSIGFKEFHEFLNSENPHEEKNGPLFYNCVDSMKCATRRYARKQIKWVTNRFLGRPTTKAPDVYGLEATDLESWKTCVLKKGLNIVKALMAREIVDVKPLERINSNAAAKHSRHVCEVCNDRTIIGEKNWAVHLGSRSHRHYKKKAGRSETK